MANIGGQEKPNNQQEQSENTTKAKVISKHEMENIKQKTLGTKPRIMTLFFSLTLVFIVRIYDSFITAAPWLWGLNAGVPVYNRI